jgi:sortase A
MTLFDRQSASGDPIGVSRLDGSAYGTTHPGPADPSGSPAQGPEARQEPDRRDTVVSVLRIALLVVAVTMIGVALNLVVVSRLEQRSSQFREFGQLRYQFAGGTGPISPVQSHHVPLAMGSPMALLTIPSIGLREVVDEGTTSQVLLSGPGHLPSTVFPGGLGTSVIYGRASTYGGPFAKIAQLRKGARILVTIQDGPINTAVFRVSDIRTGGQRIPAIGRGGSRLTLVTAKESMFVPSSVVYVDANIVGSPLPTIAPVVKAKNLPSDELPLGVDTGNLWLLALWLIALTAVVAAAVWTRHRKGQAQAWIIFVAPVALVGYFLANQISLLLPNVM